MWLEAGKRWSLLGACGGNGTLQQSAYQHLEAERKRRNQRSIASPKSLLSHRSGNRIDRKGRITELDGWHREGNRSRRGIVFDQARIDRRHNATECMPSSVSREKAARLKIHCLIEISELSQIWYLEDRKGRITELAGRLGEGIIFRRDTNLRPSSQSIDDSTCFTHTLKSHYLRVENLKHCEHKHGDPPTRGAEDHSSEYCRNPQQNPKIITIHIINC